MSKQDNSDKNTNNHISICCGFFKIAKRRNTKRKVIIA